ncbi:serine protease [Bryobacterales bacterium F-183]|nr:serine protease [Bryobacterales bacterium F-183]
MRLSPRAVLFLAMSSGGSGYLFAAGYADLVEKTVPGVVRIMTTRMAQNAGSPPVSIGFPSSGTPKGRVTGEGSGVVFSDDGYILTNQHVVEGAVRTRVQLFDGREFDARIVASDAPIDIAVLKIEAQGLKPLIFADSTKVRVGEAVLAIGNPFGVGTTVTQGIVSALSPSKLGIAGDEDYIQTDAAVNPGNSGGALINVNGELIGINTAILSTSGGSNGIGFALPANVAKSVAEDLLRDGKVRRGYLGVGLQQITPDLADALGEETGALIADVAPNSPAAKAGLQKGDVVAGMNGRTVRDFHRLRLFIAEAKPGAAVQLLVRRDGLEKNFWIVLDERPTPATAADGSSQPEQAIRLDDVIPGAAVTDGPGGSGVLVLAVNGAGMVGGATNNDGEVAVSGLRPGDLIVGANKVAVSGIEALQRQIAGSVARNAAVLLEINRLGTTYFVGLRKN